MILKTSFPIDILEQAISDYNKVWKDTSSETFDCAYPMLIENDVKYIEFSFKKENGIWLLKAINDNTN